MVAELGVEMFRAEAVAAAALLVREEGEVMVQS